MIDDLKKYTEKHRKDFDVYVFDKDMAWNAIENRLDSAGEKRTQFPWKSILRVAAIMIFLMTIGFGYYLNHQRLEINRYGFDLQDLSLDLADTEAYYTMQIDEKLDMIKAAKGNFDSNLLAQMEIFDADYQLLKKDLKDNADSEEVINAMIEHYRLKLNMLEKILKEIKKDNNNQDYEEVQAI